jgi:SH3-like domain-containing protein
MAKYLIPILFLFALAPAQVAGASIVAGEEHCVISVPAWDKLNIRSAPSSKSRIVSRKRHGSCGVMVVGNCRRQWCPVEDGHVSGWVNKRFLSMVSPALYCTVNANAGVPMALRAYPSNGSRVVVTFNRPTCGIAFLPYARRHWQKIRVKGWEGWIHRTDVSGQ